MRTRRMAQFLVMVFSLFVFLVPVASAQEEANITPPVSITPTPVQIDYTLPYPGILPGSPIYGLKVLRDNIIGFLIKDPLKKAQFDLLQADKRLEAGLMLLDERPPQVMLAETTISKGQNYFEDAIGKVSLAKKQGMLVNDFLLKLQIAGRKHAALLTDESTRFQGKEKDQLLALVKRITLLEMTVTQMVPK